MTTPDWFSHSATVPLRARQPVTRHLADYACTVDKQARIHLGEGASICVSGSLARGEPAVRRRRAGYTLGSDVDLVAVVDNPGDPAPVEKFTRALLETHPDIDSTVFAVGCRDVGRVAGRFGADLHLCADRPMAGPVPAGVANPPIGPREGLEGLTHQLATIYCPDSPLRATPWRIKTALEAVRAVACLGSCPGGPQRYSGLVDDPMACAVLNRDAVAELVRAREHSQPMPLTDARTYDLVLTAAAQLFGVAATHRDLLAALHTIPACVHLLDGFQRTVLAATVILYGPTRFRRAAASALHVTVAAIDRDTVPTALDSLNALARISPVDFGRGTDRPNRVLRAHVQGLRADYYYHLGPHNFGARPVANYTGPTSAVGSIAGRQKHG
ncbi:nucleotidyltransferase domain-containing protein [Nocardia shimofusensis]|uniref:nucleotidyltransferase domain-containing protein n=1 Tax=Nocardia shimofusensis TaxID=228596 RepID=UPI00082C1A39|nr:nucleotidyltransferase domain-containing protein [Nocardia shimofusensis]